MAPADDSPDTIDQWIGYMITSLGYVEDSQQRGGWSDEASQNSGSDTIRDCYRLVEHLRGQGHRDTPPEPERMFGAHAVIVELKKVREWLTGRADAAEAAAEAKAKEASKPCGRGNEPTAESMAAALNTWRGVNNDLCWFLLGSRLRPGPCRGTN